MATEPSGSTEYVAKVILVSSGWIASADTKATALLTVQAVLLGFTAISDTQDAPSVLRLGGTFLFLVSSIFAVIFTLAVLWPRTNRKKLIGHSTAPILERSPTFFGDISPAPYDRYRAFVENPRADILTKDAVEQSYVLARIATRKMYLLKCAVVSTTISILSLAAVSVVAIGEPPSHDSPYRTEQKAGSAHSDTNAQGEGK